jgi:hypothetical protein
MKGKISKDGLRRLVWMMVCWLDLMLLGRCCKQSRSLVFLSCDALVCWIGSSTKCWCGEAVLMWWSCADRSSSQSLLVDRLSQSISSYPDQCQHSLSLSQIWSQAKQIIESTTHFATSQPTDMCLYTCIALIALTQAYLRRESRSFKQSSLLWGARKPSTGFVQLTFLHFSWMGCQMRIIAQMSIRYFGIIFLARSG